MQGTFLIFISTMQGRLTIVFKDTSGKWAWQQFKNPFTSLAPNSDAFKSLESSAAPNLEKPENPNQLAGF